MRIRATIITLAGVFIAFALEYLPMPSLLNWLQPPWVLLLVTVLVMRAPNVFGLWMAVPLGLMLDVEHHQLLGLNVLTLGIHIVILQLLNRRLQIFHFLQIMVVVVFLVLLHQILTYLAIALVAENREPIPFWQPMISTAIVWPWFYAISYISMKRLNLA